MELTATVTNRLADGDMVTLIRHGKRPGAEALFDTYARFLHLVIIRINPDREMAELTLLTTFKKIWQGIDGYAQEGGEIYTWMRTIAQKEAVATLTSSSKNYEAKNQGFQAGKR